MLIPLQLTSDARIVGRVLGGRRDEFGVLVERYYRAVESVARARLENSVDAEDVAQEAFVSAYRKLDTLMEPQKFGPWVMAIARNAAVSWIRRRKSEVLVADVAMVAGPVDAPPVERAELQRIVRAKLQDMEPEQREILMLFYYGGKTVGEVASLLEITKDAASKRLQRAREALGSEFLKSVGEERKPDKSADGKRARRAVMAVVASAPVVWEGKAAAAGSAALAVVKVLIGTLAVAVIGTGVVVGVKHAQSTEPGVATVQQTEPVTQLAAAAPVEAGKAVEEQEPELTGPGRIEVILLDGDSEQPVGSADVTAEMVTWGPREMPPQTTFKKTGKADGQGTCVLEDLPVGTYCIAAMTPTQCGVDNYFMRREDIQGTLRIWMRPRVSIPGSLTGPDGGPVAGAAIYPLRHILMPNDTLGHTEAAVARATTDADGRFSFPMIFPGAWQFYIVSPNLPPAITDYQMIEGELLLKLDAAGSIAGHVLDAGSGEGRGRVVIRAFQGDKDYLGNPSGPRSRDDNLYGWRVAVEVESGPDGTFRLANVAPGKYKIETADAALLNASPDVEFEVKPGEETAIDVHVAVGATILGRVYNRDTGEGLAGMGIYGPEGTATTDASGEYMLTGLKPGSYNLMVGFPTGEAGAYRFSGDPSMETTATVTYGQVLEHVDFAAKPAATVKGRVIDRTGAPVGGTTVHIRHNRGWEEAKTGEDGSFRHNPSSIENLRYVGKKDGWQSEVVAADVSEEVVLTLTVPANGAIHGTALSAEGKPLVLYRVRAGVIDESSEDASPAWYSAETKTGPGGQFVLEHLAPGTYELYAYARIAGHDSGVKKLVRVGQNQIVEDFVLRPESPGGLSISGRLVTPDGGELHGATVLIPWGPSVRVEPDGRFVLNGLQDGTHTLVASCAGYSPATVDAETGTQNLIVKLTAPAVLSGTVTDARTGKPITVFTLNAVTDPPVGYSETVNTDEARSCSNDQGRFEIENFAAMRVRVAIAAEGYALWEQEVTLEGGKPSELAVQLEPGAVVRGVVTDPGGNPVAGAEIRWGWVDARPYVPESMRSDEAGAFETRALPEGVTTRLFATHRDYAPACVDVVPRRGQDVVNVVLPPAGSLEVHVLLDGEPTDDWNVGLLDQCVAEPYAYGSSGGVLVGGIPAGEADLTVTVYAEDGTSQQQVVTATVEAGQTTPVEVSFKSHEGLDGNKEE